MNVALWETREQEAEREGGRGRDTGGICAQCQGENKGKETRPSAEKWRSPLCGELYHCNAAQCQKRSCVCCRFISFRRH